MQWVMENGGAKDKATSRDQSRADGSGGIGAHHVKERREIIDQIIREEVGDALYFFSESELKNKVILLLEKHGIGDTDMMRKNIENPVSLGFMTRYGHPQ